MLKFKRGGLLMKLIKNYIDVRTDCEDNFLIHPYCGEIYVIGKKEIKMLSKWSKMSNIICDTSEEEEFFNHLLKKGFLVDKEEEEGILADKVLKASREHHEKLQREINSAVFVLTYACNFACPYCYESGNKENTTKVMTREMVDTVFAMYNNKIDNIALYGGEPLLLQNKEIIEYIISKAPNAKYSITTNGYNIIEFIDILSRIDINNIMITLDGPKDIHNKTRILKHDVDVNGTYDRIIFGIDRLLDKNIKVKIRMNISENNKSACENLRDELINKYNYQFSQGLLVFELQPIFQLSSTTRDNLNEELVYSQGKRKNINSYNTMAISVSPILDSFIRNNRKFMPRYTFCDAETNRRFFDAEGDIYSCILALKNKNASIGTYYPVIEYKKSSMITRNIENLEKCKNCKFRFLCGGGCANAIIDENGDVMKSNCSILNEVYNVLPTLFKKRISK